MAIRDPAKIRIILAAFLALIFAGPGTTIDSTVLGWAAWIACPSGTRPEPPGSLGLYCIGPDGTRLDRTLPAMGGLALMYFMGLMVVFTFLIPGGPAQQGAGRPDAAPGRSRRRAR